MSLPTADELATYSLAQQHPVTRDWCPADRRHRLLSEEHELDVELGTDRDLATIRRDRFAPQVPVDFLFNSWHPVVDDLAVLLSARWEHGDPDRPFVDVSALSRPLRSAELPQVAAVAWQRFGRFAPRYLRWWSCEAAGYYPRTLPDKRFMAARLGMLAGRGVPSALQLKAAEDLSHYAAACEAYQAVDHEHPAHRSQATVDSPDDLEELIEDGTLFDVLIDGRWCGYVGAEQRHRLGLPGFNIAELILTPAARGRGLGRHLLALLAQTLLVRGEAGDSVIIGTIHYNNRGAMLAAKQSGRLDVGGWVIHPFPAVAASYSARMRSTSEQ